MGHKNGVTYNCFDVLNDANLFVVPDIINDPFRKPCLQVIRQWGVDNFGTVIYAWNTD